MNRAHGSPPSTTGSAPHVILQVEHLTSRAETAEEIADMFELPDVDVVRRILAFARRP
jgi:hypothetical protein